MFGKKPAPPPVGSPQPTAAQPAPAAPPGWAVQILTTEYIVTGYLPPIDMPLVSWLNVPTQIAVTLIHAQVAELYPSARLAVEVHPEVTVPKSCIVSLIPRDEKSQRSASSQTPSRLERATIYAGPYLVRASFQLSGEMPLRHLFGGTPGDMLTVSDAEIQPVRPDANYPLQKAPVLILSKSRVQLYYAA